MDVHELTAREVLGLLERGELSSVDVVRGLHARTDVVDREVNAFAHELRSEALREAEAADRMRRGGELKPLLGLPVTIKESVDVRGLPSTLGVSARLGALAQEDAVVVRLLRDAGAVVLGKTNVPQTLLSPMETTNFIWGTTRNPWSLDHGPGGSSGGEGAAIASGQSVLGVGTDIGGSIRFPAGFCGICGLKPTLHRWSNLGSRTAVVGQEVVRSQIGPMARTTGDLALLMEALDSPRHSPHDPNVPPVPVGNPAAVDLSGLRVGYYETDGFFEPAGYVRRAVREAVRSLEAAGATVAPFEPPNAADVVYLMFAALSSDGGQGIDRLLEGERAIEPLSVVRRVTSLPSWLRRLLATTMRMRGEHRVARLLSELGRKDVSELWRLTGERSRYQMEEHAAWQRAGIDALVCPLHVTGPVPHGTSKDFTLSFLYAARYNVLNLPAGAVPVTRVGAEETDRPLGSSADRLDRRAAEIQAQSAGLPVAVQVVGRPWQEAKVLAVMDTIERGARSQDGFPRTPVETSTKSRGPSTTPRRA